MRHPVLTLAALLAATSASPAQAAGDAARGLQALSEYNLITLGDWESSSHVDGKVFIGGDALGSGAVVGAGGGGGSTGPVDRPTVVIRGDNLMGTLHVNNGNNAGHPLSTGASAVIGGKSGGTLSLGGSNQMLLVGKDFSTTNLNLGAGDSVSVGGHYNAGGAINNGANVQIGGAFNGSTTSGNPNVQAGLGAGFNAAQVAGYTNIFSDLSSDLTILSSSLAGLSSGLSGNPSGFSIIEGKRLVLNAVAGGNDFAVIALTASDLNNIQEIDYDFSAAGSTPLVINVTGDDLNIAANFLGGSVNRAQQVIWNFQDATNIEISGSQFYGSILATMADLHLSSNNINGSVAVGSLRQSGELHNYGYNGGDFLPPPAVPEPATWAMIILGFGLVGTAMRRRKTSIQFA